MFFSGIFLIRNRIQLCVPNYLRDSVSMSSQRMPTAVALRNSSVLRENVTCK